MSVELKNLTYRHSDEDIFHNVDFVFEENKLYTLLGPSGVGKSTLLHLLKKMSLPTSGTIDYNHVSDSDIVMVFQQNQLFPWATVRDALSLPLKIARWPKDARLNKVESLANALSIEELLDRKVTNLSGGQMQRVAIAQGLATDPRILLLDEPTSSLDTQAKEAIQHLLLKEQETRKTTMIIVTHDIEEAVFLGHDILLIKEQQIQRIQNPVRRSMDQRESLDFYEFCISLRKQVRL